MNLLKVAKHAGDLVRRDPDCVAVEFFPSFPLIFALQHELLGPRPVRNGRATRKTRETFEAAVANQRRDIFT